MKVLAWPAFKTRYKNPYNWLLYQPMVELGAQVDEFSPRRLLRHRYDVVHLHWPVETIVRHPRWPVALGRTLLFLTLLRWARWRGAKVVWTVHDERPHVLLHPWLARWCEAQLVDIVDGTIHLCEASQGVVAKALPQLAAKPSTVIPHGHYRPAYANAVSHKGARRRLQLPEQGRVLLFLGHISPYKNVPQLVVTFRQLREERVQLVVAGRPDNNELRRAIEAAAGDDDRVHLHLRFIPDEQLQVFFSAADLVVLPFGAILNSGSTLLALSFDRPVLAPGLGALPEWEARLGGAWVRTYAGGLSPQVLRQGLDSPPLPGPGARAPLETLDWPPLAEKTLHWYRQLGA